MSERTNQLIIRKTVISFTVFALFIIGCILSWKWLRQQPEDGGVEKPLRAGLTINESIFSKLVSDEHLEKEYPKSMAAVKARVNGNIGMSGTVDSNYTFNVIKHNGDTLKIAVDEIMKLPKTEVVYNFKCIEGWSQITWWGGVRLSDFMKAYHLDAEAGDQFVGMETPDKKYYVGIDMRSALHPQTILCYQLNGKPLPREQGYPVRLIIPIKYGVKSIKKIGTISFSDARPRDYWAEQGYDYFTGL